MVKRFLYIVIVLILLMNIPESKAQYIDFEHNNLSRQYLYYAPSDLKGNAPLVFVMHGFTSNALDAQKQLLMDSIADEYGFAVCYPQGSTDEKGNTFWNVGYDFHKGVTVDDVGFLVALAKHLQNTHHLNPQNTFATGMSNGGEMCYLLACEAPEIFSAVAPVAGMMLKKIFDNHKSKKLIPIFEIHGTKDGVNRYEGDIEGKDGWGAYPDIPFTINYWIELNKCTETKIDTLPDINKGDGSFVISEKHLNGIHGNQIWLYKVINGKHNWPGVNGNMDIQTSREVWLFFRQFITKA